LASYDVASNVCQALYLDVVQPTTGRGDIEKRHSTDVESPPPPPHVCTRVIESKHSIDIESPPPPFLRTSV
jgi:hypothetical protein